MKLKLENADHTTAFQRPPMKRPREVASTGMFRVTADVGEALLDEYDDIVPYETGGDADADGPSESTASDE